MTNARERKRERVPLPLSPPTPLIAHNRRYDNYSGREIPPLGTGSVTAVYQVPRWTTSSNGFRRRVWADDRTGSSPAGGPMAMAPIGSHPSGTPNVCFTRGMVGGWRPKKSAPRPSLTAESRSSIDAKAASMYQYGTGHRDSSRSSHFLSSSA